MKRIIIISIILLSIQLLYSGPIVEMDAMDARSISLANSSGVVEKHVHSIQNNPSGLGYVDKIETGISYISWIEQTSFLSFSGCYALPEKYGTAGMNLTFFSIPEFDNYDEYGNQLTPLDASDFMVTLGYGYPLFFFHEIKIGASMKLLRTRLADESATGFGLDLGTMSSFSVPTLMYASIPDNLLIGISVQNIGFGQKYSNESDSLPLKLRTGAGYKFIQYQFITGTFLLELNKTKSSPLKINNGLEAEFYDMLALRLGIKWIGNNFGVFNFGFGGQYQISGYDFSLDYAMIPTSDLGNSHILSLQSKF